jgi:NitT/TauT family transport system substrate-binding protein
MLKGKSVLAGRTGGMPAMVFEYALYKNGLSKKDVNVDNSVDFASLSGAYIGGTGDFVNLFEPTALNLEKEGYGCVLASIGLMSGEVPYTVFHTKKSYLEKNKDLIEKFTKAIGKGLKFVKENDSEKIAKVIKDEFPDTDINDLIKVVDRYKEADSWWDTTFISQDAYNNLLDLMEYNDALDERIDYKVIVDNSFNE